MPLLANVGTGADALKAADAGAEGVGLLRTEFCFLDRDEEPTVAEQIAAYGAVFAAFPEKKVVVRTLDAGADKPLPFLTNADEPNPALGVRGYRTDLTSPACWSASWRPSRPPRLRTSAEVWVMAPMISTADEAATFRRALRRRRAQDPRRHGGGPLGCADGGHGSARGQLSHPWAPTTSPNTPWPPTGSWARWPP